MNQQQREAIKKLTAKLEDIHRGVDELASEERDKTDNMEDSNPEYEEILQAADALENVASNLQDALDELTGLI